MDTIDNEMLKEAAKKMGPLGAAFGMSSGALKTYLTVAAALGLAGGFTTGAVASYVKGKNPKLTALKRKQEFYNKKIDEMENENWLNDIMDSKRKLETARLTDEERDELEKKYIKLLDK